MDKLGPHVLTDQIKELDKMGRIYRNLNNSPPIKDTVTVPDGGYTIIRFHADNPGKNMIYITLRKIKPIFFDTQLILTKKCMFYNQYLICIFLLGYWLFHCHIEFHVELGMALIFKVGENDEMPPTPKNFPECNDWIPDDMNPDTSA